MEFAIMVWKSGNVRPFSIFGVLAKANPGILPTISRKGHWVHYGDLLAGGDCASMAGPPSPAAARHRQLNAAKSGHVDRWHWPGR
jgi:hypothetical protein